MDDFLIQIGRLIVMFLPIGVTSVDVKILLITMFIELSKDEIERTTFRFAAIDFFSAALQFQIKKRKGHKRIK